MRASMIFGDFLHEREPTHARGGAEQEYQWLESASHRRELPQVLLECVGKGCVLRMKYTGNQGNENRHAAIYIYIYIYAVVFVYDVSEKSECECE